MTASHIILVTPDFPNGFSAPVICVALSLLFFFSFKHMKVNHHFSPPVFDFFFWYSNLFFNSLSVTHYDSLPSSAGYLSRPLLLMCFPTSVSASPAWCSSNEFSLRWGWPEVSWTESERLMRIGTLLFALGCKDRVNEWTRPGADKTTDSFSICKSEINWCTNTIISKI